MEAVAKFIFMGCKITVNCGYSHEIAPWKESYGKPRQHINKQKHHSANKSLYSQNYGFSSSHVCMLQLDHKEG